MTSSNRIRAPFKPASSSSFSLSIAEVVLVLLISLLLLLSCSSCETERGRERASNKGLLDRDFAAIALRMCDAKRDGRSADEEEVVDKDEEESPRRGRVVVMTESGERNPLSVRNPPGASNRALSTEARILIKTDEINECICSEFKTPICCIPPSLQAYQCS